MLLSQHFYNETHYAVSVKNGKARYGKTACDKSELKKT